MYIQQRKPTRLQPSRCLCSYAYSLLLQRPPAFAGVCLLLQTLRERGVVAEGFSPPLPATVQDQDLGQRLAGRQARGEAAGAEGPALLREHAVEDDARGRCAQHRRHHLVCGAVGVKTVARDVQAAADVAAIEVLRADDRSARAGALWSVPRTARTSAHNHHRGASFCGRGARTSSRTSTTRVEEASGLPKVRFPASKGSANGGGPRFAARALGAPRLFAVQTSAPLKQLGKLVGADVAHVNSGHHGAACGVRRERHARRRRRRKARDAAASLRGDESAPDGRGGGLRRDHARAGSNTRRERAQE